MQAGLTWPARLRLQLEALGAPRAVEEHRALPPRMWRFDLAWPEWLVAVEVEGGVWSKKPGRHTRGAGFEADCEKYNAATAAGWRVVRVTTKMIADGRAHDQVLAVLRGAGCEVKSSGRIQSAFEGMPGTTSCAPTASLLQRWSLGRSKTRTRR